MHILVIGANGRVGEKLVEYLLEQNHKITGTSRKEERLFDHENYNQIQFDLTDPKDKLASSFPETINAVYFVSGSRGKDLLQVDLHGAVKTVQIAEEKSIKRYIMLSGFNSLNPESFHADRVKPLLNYYISKHYADLYLMHNTSLDYTIFQPGPLKERKGSGNVALNIEEAGDSSIENVAKSLAEMLEQTNTFKKAITMRDGDQPIAQALSEI